MRTNQFVKKVTTALKNVIVGISNDCKQKIINGAENAKKLGELPDFHLKSKLKMENEVQPKVDHNGQSQIR